MQFLLLKIVYRRGIYALVCVWMLSLLGCDSDGRPEGVPVTGVVSYRGQPLEGADVAFSSSDRDIGGTFARTDAEGRFQLASQKTSVGIPPGSYKVKITKIMVDSDWHEEHDEGVRPKETEKLGLPVKYGSFNTSELSADVVSDGENIFEFELVD